MQFRRIRMVVPMVALIAVTALVSTVSAQPGAQSSAGTKQATVLTAAAAEPLATDSYPPSLPLPAPGNMPSGSTMKKIQERGRLIVGVSPDSLLWGFEDPQSHEFRGFDIDIARQVARAIFGTDEGHIQFKALTSADRIPALKNGDVDMVVQTMTITRDRWQQIDFSEEYYHAAQRLLVSVDSGVTSIEQMSGKKVCAATGSTSVKNIEKYGVQQVSVDNWTMCLVLLQLGQVDAVSTDDTLLAGLQSQDPTTAVVGEKFTDEPYGIGVAKGHDDFVRFINGVLVTIKKDGTWTNIYNRWMGRIGAAPQPPVGTYSETPGQ